MKRKAAFRVFALRMRAAKEKAFLETLQAEFKPGEVSCYAIGSAIVLESNLQAAIQLLSNKGWQEDSNGSHYSVMTRDGDSCALRLDASSMPVGAEEVTISAVAHPDPGSVRAGTIYADPSDFLVDPSEDNYEQDMETDTQIGDPSPLLPIDNVSHPPSIPVSGFAQVFGELFPKLRALRAKRLKAGGAGGTGSGAVQPSTEPEGLLHSPEDNAKINQRLKRLEDRRTGKDRDNSGLPDDESLLEEPGTPVDNRKLNFADDKPVFMADQPYGYNTDVPVQNEDMLNIKTIAPMSGTESVQDEDLPIGTTDGTIMANGLTLMARIKAAKHRK